MKRSGGITAAQSKINTSSNTANWELAFHTSTISQERKLRYGAQHAGMGWGRGQDETALTSHPSSALCHGSCCSWCLAAASPSSLFVFFSFLDFSSFISSFCNCHLILSYLSCLNCHYPLLLREARLSPECIYCSFSFCPHIEGYGGTANLVRCTAALQRARKSCLLRVQWLCKKKTPGMSNTPPQTKTKTVSKV